jgi:hypothetical protein
MARKNIYLSPHGALLKFSDIGFQRPVQNKSEQYGGRDHCNNVQKNNPRHNGFERPHATDPRS